MVGRSKNARSTQSRFAALSELIRARDLLTNLTLREVRGKYKRTALGQAWSLVNPLSQMLVYTLIFGFVLKANPPAGNPSGIDVFALWLTTALLPFLFFQNAVMSGMTALLNNSGLIKKVYFPRETLVISSVASLLVTFAIEMSVLTAVLIAFGSAPWLYLPAVVVFIALLSLFALGLALALAVAVVYFRDTQHFMSIAMQIWFYATPVVYPASLIVDKHPKVATLYRLNPTERFSEVFRNLLYDNRWPSLSNTLFLIGVSLGMLVIGYVTFKRFEGKLAEEL